MGCRESKLQDVVTGNTVAQRKKTKADSKRIVPPESRPDDKTRGLAAAAAAEGGGSVTANGKEGESRELDGESERSGEEEEDVGRSISRESPNHYFSSRKDDELIDVISTEERSVYSSPPHEAAAAAAGKEINREKPEDDAAAMEMRPETEMIDGGEHMKMENLIKESETETPPAEGLSMEEKIANPAEENVTRTDKDDQNAKQE